MERENNSMRNPDHSREQKMDETDLSIDKTVSGKDRSEEGREERRHQQAHGNRKYESHTNHSSADDQPQVNTDLNPERGRI